MSSPLNLLLTDATSIEEASNDYGNIIHHIPSAVLNPSSIQEIIDLVKLSYESSTPFTISPRGQSHSVRGQAMARDGLVVNMMSLSKTGPRITVSSDCQYVDVGGEVLWIDVLKATIERGVAPVTWTDYLYLSVGGTLSNAGISGQTFLHGPFISNVLELDVITGKGEFITCCKNNNAELFFAVLGGLGQFGIITRARIIVDKAPTRVKWMRLIYRDFMAFSKDQEYLISSNVPDYIEGFLITDETTTNIWRSSFSSPSSQSEIATMLKKQRILYSIELVKYYDYRSAATIDEEVDALLGQLSFISSMIFSKDSSFVNFIERVSKVDAEDSLKSHPWLNLFIPKSRISDFHAGVLESVVPKFTGPDPIFIFYPINRSKGDDRMSAVIPGEEVFYKLALLHATKPEESESIDELNNQILLFCETNRIEVKQYLPHFKTLEEWINHFGSKFETIRERKILFDPKCILSPGQGIFNS